MKHLKYCPQCGNSTLEWDENKKWSCTCGFSLYHNVAGAVAVVITFENQIFLTRRNQEPKKGMLDLAGGFVDPKESAEFTCKRELLEELQIDIDTQKLKYITSLPNVYHYRNISYHTLDLFYEYNVDKKLDVNLALDEISEGIWIQKSEIKLDEIAFDSQRKFLEDYIKNP